MAKKETTNPFQDFMQMFDPANMGKAFDPADFMKKISTSPTSLDPQDIIEKSKAQFDAMAKANEAAAQSYRDLMAKQMKVFQDLTSEAAEQAKGGPPQDVSAAYQQAVNRALEIMTELSDSAREANKQAYDAIKGHVDEAMKDLKS
ncbi:hypothetical protein Q4555_06460 [Octadecabacter sp. 1_MG-2023]|uniref:hypothetical protein n=1 Tax=unclassified Octadecabacter TaxID=196158 RepID=UPI001C091BB3|nr:MULTISPECIES: hypothetical protein [unclassified Octadecabacter]MBU2994407.1 hypothetical protein [Octadecabacter sp. B2R22]MDO6734302.1 hypothetical protein [Octadecabacter sp. 1_MG-2023]